MGTTLTVEFQFDIGDLVYCRSSNHDFGSRPHQYIVLEQLGQWCHAGGQKLYRLTDWDGMVPEIALSAEEPPMRIRSEESIVEEERIAAMRTIFRRATARQAVPVAEDRQDTADGAV